MLDLSSSPQYQPLISTPVKLTLTLSPNPTRAQVERKPAVRNFDAICLAADGVLISRGNLGLDYDAEVSPGMYDLVGGMGGSCRGLVLTHQALHCF